MVEPRWKVVSQGLLLGTLYCMIYLGAWQISLNQWYLPAGIRITSLLLFPYRYWPFLIIGDMAALFVQRIPKAEKYSELWAYGTPILIILMVAVVPWLLRRWQTSPKTLARWLPLNAALGGTWSAACLMATNFYMGGPKQLVTVHNFISYSVGNYLGIMMIAIPSLVLRDWWWSQKRGTTRVLTKKILRNSAMSVGVIGGLLFIATALTDDRSVLILALLMMGLPATFLAVAHGWVGAAIGIFAMNAAVAMALPEADFSGQFDESVFIVQQVLCVLSAMLLLLGGRITDHYERARKSGIEEREARKLAKDGFWLNETNFKGQSNHLAFVQLRTDQTFDQLAETLKENRQFEAALAVKGGGATQRRLLDLHANTLYPKLIESGGLLAVLHSDVFKDQWVGDAVLTVSFKGQPRDMPQQLQLNAYRSICCALIVLSEGHPSEIMIYCRTGNRASGAFLHLVIAGMPTTDDASMEESRSAWSELVVRTKAHGGIVKRRHADRISLWLPACSDAG